MLSSCARRLLLCATACALPLASPAADFTLRFAHFWPAATLTSKDIYEAWANAVEEDSGGRIEVEIYPSQTLAKAPASYEAVKNRIADMTATVQGYTANRFPLTQVVELPGLVPSAKVGSCALQSLYNEGLISGEYDDTHVLFLFTHGPGHIHTTGKLVTKPDDLVGLRIRRPTTVVGSLLEELGGKPVGMPAPDIYPSLQRGVIDGATLPWEGAHSFRINELVKYHTEVGLYTLAFVVTMNKDLYNEMPDDLRAVIDKHSGQTWSTIAANSFDALDEAGRADAVELGHEILTLEGGAEHPQWKSVLDTATEKYLTELEEQGLPARQVYQRAQDLRDSCAAR